MLNGYIYDNNTWKKVSGNEPSNVVVDTLPNVAEAKDGVVYYVKDEQRQPIESVSLGEVVNKLASGVVPVGCIIAVAGDKIPSGYLLCNGASLDTVVFTDLFNAIGYTYGGGGNKFNLPDLTDRFIQGSSVSGDIREAGLPNIVGEMTGIPSYSTQTVGAFYYNGSDNADIAIQGRAEYQRHTYGINASRSNSIYGNSDTVQPPSVTMQYVIKAFNCVTYDEAQVNMASILQQLSNADFVIEKGGDSTKWYRKYKSGWLEQGGIINGNTSITSPITLLKPMADTNYNCWCTVIHNGNPSNAEGNARLFQLSTTQLGIASGVSNTYTKVVWNVCGQGANE